MESKNMSLLENRHLHRVTSIIDNSEHGVDTLTFLKSNYKYKRRAAAGATPEVPKNYAGDVDRTGNATDGGGGAGGGFAVAAHSKRDQFTFSTILQIFIAFVGDRKERGTAAASTATANANDDDSTAAAGGAAEMPSAVATIATLPATTMATLNGSAIAARLVDESNQRRNDDKVSVLSRCQGVAWPSQTQTPVAITRSARQRWWWWRSLDCRLLSSSPSAPPSATTLSIGVRYTQALSILMTLFIALALAPRATGASWNGACWQTTLENGKCSEIYSLNITRAECCSRSDFSYTDRALTSVEYFFATAIGGGMECTPCQDNCKAVHCGPNKKCVKRKGRPKCICAPECGAAARRKQKTKLYWSQEHHGEYHRDVVRRRPLLATAVVGGNGDGDGDGDGDGVGGIGVGGVEAALLQLGKSARDIRSLSSEITNMNLGLESAELRHNQSQRKLNRTTPSQSEDPHQQSPQKPQISKREPKPPKPRRLLITANVEPEQHGAKPTTRRLQIISNVRVRSKGAHRNNGNHDNGGGAGDDDATRSSVQQTTRDSHNKSRRKSNKINRNRNRDQNRNRNNNASDHNELQLIKSQQEVEGHYEPNNKNNKPRIRHIHKNARESSARNEAAEHDDNAPDHAEVVSKQQQERHNDHRHQQQQKQKQRRRQQKNRHKQPNHHHHHHQHHQQQQKHQQTQRGKKLKDPNANATQTAPMMTTAAEADAAATPSSLSSQSLPVTTTAIRLQTSLATPVNSSVSADRRLLNRGSDTAASSSTSSSSSTSPLSSTFQDRLLSSSVATAPVAATTTVSGGEGVSPSSPTIARADGSSFANSDESTFLDGIYDKFNLHGFPNKQHAITHVDNSHHAHPVCGTDGRTYNTECQLKKRACRTDNPNLQLAYRGHCKTTCGGVKCLNGLTCVEDHYTIPHCIACKIDCPRDDTTDGDAAGYDDVGRAVCGVDGQTYKSICDINRMICKIGRAIAVAYPGPCREDRVTCSNISCGPKHTCLIDLLSHEPRCVSCSYKCARKRRPTPLRFEEGKICGVNNRTYNSWCEMRKDSCATGFFIDVRMPGACQ